MYPIEPDHNGGSEFLMPCEAFHLISLDAICSYDVAGDNLDLSGLAHTSFWDLETKSSSFVALMPGTGTLHRPHTWTHCNKIFHHLRNRIPDSVDI